MTCGEVRELLFAFLDNELDAALSIEVQRHLEHCPECAREAETERMIQKRLAGVMERVAVKPSAPDEWLRAVVTGPASPPPRRRLQLRVWLSLGVGVAAVLLLGLFVQKYLGAKTTSPRESTLADWLVGDFEHFLDEGASVQLASADARAVSDWLRDRTSLAVELPSPSGSTGKLLGARKCKRDGVPVAFAAYEMDGLLASFVVLPANDHELESLRRVEHGGQTHWVDRCKGHTVVACRRGELVYAAVGRLPEEALLGLMSPAPPNSAGLP